MTDFFTADPHLGHANIIKHCHRPFRTHDGRLDVALMDRTIIKNWNSVVGRKDRVYVLGDFCHWKGLKADHYLKKLNGSKVLIKGNHDKKDTLQAKGWEAVHTRYNYSQAGETIILDHYALRSWDRSFHGSWHLYGHTHGRLIGARRSFDIGMDAWNFFPIPFSKIRDIMKTLDNDSEFDPRTLWKRNDDSS